MSAQWVVSFQNCHVVQMFEKELSLRKFSAASLAALLHVLFGVFAVIHSNSNNYDS